MVDAVRTSETSTRRYNPEDGHLQQRTFFIRRVTSFQEHPKPWNVYCRHTDVTPVILPFSRTTLDPNEVFLLSRSRQMSRASVTAEVTALHLTQKTAKNGYRHRKHATV
jgi:hypothetical protein